MGDEGEWKSASWKESEDWSAQASEIIARINATTIPVLLRSEAKPLADYIDELLAVEKKARLGSDSISTQRIAVEVIRITRAQREYDSMLKYLELLIRRRAQMKQVQSAMVSEAQLALAIDGPEHDPAMTPEKRTEVLSRLCNATDGKIHLELEHARFTYELAELAEREGRLQEASDKLLAIQVETITNMPRLEKLKILLHEIRLALDIKDFHRCQVMSRKINYRALKKDDTKEIKKEYFALMCSFYDAKEAPYHVARCWREIYLVHTDKDEKLKALSRMIVLILISPHMTDTEVEDLAECTAFSPETKYQNRNAALKELMQDKTVQEELAVLFRLLKAFCSAELIREVVSGEVAELSDGHPLLCDAPSRRAELQNRLSEHDLLVVAQHYTQISLNRLATMVGLPPSGIEAFIMKLVASNSICAKIDRADQVVVFKKIRNPIDIVDEWNQGIEKVLALVERSCHLIAKERMLQSGGFPTASSNRAAKA